MTVDELLSSYREIFAMSESEKRDRFERLMRNFLLTYPVRRSIVSEVWRWKNFPFRQEFGGRDLGIDLVVKTIDGEYWAAQGILTEVRSLRDDCGFRLRISLPLMQARCSRIKYQL